MLKKIFLLPFLFFILGTNAQNKIRINGKILDAATNIALQSATVYLENAKDSTITNYAFTDKNGFFELEIKKIIKPVFLKISFLGYKTFQQELSELSIDKDFETIYLEEFSNVLDEIVIKNDVAPIRFKKDTLEYNLRSFKIRKDFTIEKALKLLPGINIDNNGKITSNGKEVDKILVDGKPFFDETGKIALQNLPSEIIDKVQIVDSKTKSEAFSGAEAASDKKTINLTIQESKNKGKFGNLTIGIGNNNSNESNVFFNYFNEDQKISLVQSSNNVKTINNSIAENAAFDANNNEIKSQTNSVGMNYQDKFLKKIDVFGTYNFNNSDNNNSSQFTKTNLLLTGNRITKAAEFSETKSNEHNVSFNAEMAIDTTSTINFSTRFAKNKSKSANLSKENTRNTDNAILNNSENSNVSNSEQTTIVKVISCNKKFKSDRILTTNYESEIMSNEIFNEANSENKFQDTSLNFDRKQNGFENKSNIKNKFDASYTFPISDSLRMNFSNEVKFDFNESRIKTFDFNPIKNNYSDLNNLQSFDVDSQLIANNTTFGLNLNKQKINMSLQMGAQFLEFNNKGFYNNQTIIANKKYVYPKVNLNAGYNFSTTKTLSINYGFDVNLPTTEQILPIENIANPLYATVGNEFLKPQKTHNFSLNYNYFKDETFLSANINANLVTDNIVSATVFDANNISKMTYVNVANSKNISGGMQWNTTKNFEKFKLIYNVGLGSNFSQSLGLNNNELFLSNAFSINPSATLNLVFDEIITITPTYQLNFSSTSYKNSTLEKFNNSQHNLQLAMVCFVPKNFIFESDFSYTTNANAASGFNNEIYLWNASLIYNFWKDRFSAKLRVFDILNQNQTTQREITNTAIIDKGNAAISRYGIISLTYNLKQFESEKPKEIP